MSDVPEHSPTSDAKAASQEAGIYVYSRLAASLFVLLALALGARLYSKDDFAYIAAVLLLYESAVALGSTPLAERRERRGERRPRP